MVLEKLIETLMRTAIEHAGADRGLLILLRCNEPQIEAERQVFLDEPARAAAVVDRLKRLHVGFARLEPGLVKRPDRPADAAAQITPAAARSEIERHLRRRGDEPLLDGAEAGRGVGWCAGGAGDHHLGAETDSERAPGRQIIVRAHLSAEAAPRQFGELQGAAVRQLLRVGRERRNRHVRVDHEWTDARWRILRAHAGRERSDEENGNGQMPHVRRQLYRFMLTKRLRSASMDT